MIFLIKNMVCNRCIAAVQDEFERLSIKIKQVRLGRVDTQSEVSIEKLASLRERLTSIGFEILDDSKKQLIERVKNIVIEKIHHSYQIQHSNFSTLLSKELYKDYSYLSNLFSEVEGITIEKYIINQKIERVKELIIYDQLSLSQIAYQLGYSSVAHLSNQFKKVTGLTPTHFRKVGADKRKPLDQV